MNNTSRLGAFLMAGGGLLLTVLAASSGLKEAAMVLAGLVFLTGLTLLNAGLRSDS